ncbi:FYVE zinc finger domain-containing protein [Spironucleus salmonicida]|uniref:FYVE zinc finger domain-containing protein n=1 Tax=Spironucleus salmonicida TaxID=348837 RepID=V6LJV0_9EUKA|nr:FYVE zinc finger domain-containing protein [Spironucleus salmonicida]|eukprot:EST43996.1 FYVE zinc finger domain-containing protein [Spironucleus salmonicida]
MSILSAEVQRANMYLNNGIDISLSISYPQTSLVPKHEWIQDNSVTDCMLCHSPFTFLIRRHHCRRCGRVMCDKCCPKSLLSGFAGSVDRLCKLCDCIIRLDQQNLSPDQYTINQYFETDFLMQAFDSNDFVLFSEGLRLLQNSMRNFRTRSELLQYSQTLFSKITFFFKQSIQTLQDCQKFQFIDSKIKQMTQTEAKSIIQHIISLCINLSATKNQEFAIFLLKTETVDLMIEVLRINIDLVRQEGALWVLKNLSQTQQGAQQIVNSLFFKESVLCKFSTNIKSIQECACSLLSNILYHIPLKTLDLYSEKNWRQMLEILPSSQPLFQCQIIRYLGCFYINEQLNINFLNNDFLEILISFVKRDVTYDDQAETTALMENYVISSSLKLLGQIIYLQNFDSKLLCNSISAMTGIISRMARQELLSSVYATYILKGLLEQYPQDTYKIINGSKSIKSLFVDTLTKCIDSHYPNDQIRDLSRQIFKILQSMDQKQILSKVKQNFI